MNIMTMSRRPNPTDPGAVLLDRCPGCGAGMLIQVGAPLLGRFLCRACLRCWEPTQPAPVDPAECPGCEWRWACESRMG